MTKAVRELLQNGRSYDETDRMPDKINVTHLDLFMYMVAIIGHFVDLGVDINIAVRYSLARKMTEFGWTLAFILVPAFVNTAVSIRMYSLDKQQNSLTNEFTKRKWLQIFILVLQMAPILRFTDALIYAFKSRRAAHKHDTATQRKYYNLMLKEDSDAALLRIFECFLEAAPQQVLQTSLLLRANPDFTVHQILSIASSIIGMGWCLAAYQRAVRFYQPDKDNMSWTGTALQTIWHFLVTRKFVIHSPPDPLDSVVHHRHGLVPGGVPARRALLPARQGQHELDRHRAADHLALPCYAEPHNLNIGDRVPLPSLDGPRVPHSRPHHRHTHTSLRPFSFLLSQPHRRYRLLFRTRRSLPLHLHPTRRR
ncbi:hypothetical protein PYW07_009793 [Mythimna separata]|uniref:XK-related protein n=1 Tax=Mythimna separata TaxID=271217 RepID=A0AAD7YC57_MYTSE|nr:hypothetical protein PYW07_009793 [Mythimna separata]